MRCERCASARARILKLLAVMSHGSRPKHSTVVWAQGEEPRFNVGSAATPIPMGAPCESTPFYCELGEPVPDSSSTARS